MEPVGWGRIVAIGSSGVIQPIQTLVISNVVRSALVGLTKFLSNDLAGCGITVNMLLPGRTHQSELTNLNRPLLKRQVKY